MNNLVAIVALLVSDLYPGFTSLFQTHEYAHVGGGYQKRVSRYRLFVPVLERNRKYPLIVWLHGRGESGHDNEWHLRWLDQLVLLPPWNRLRFPFFVLAVQCPEDNPFWYRTTWASVMRREVSNSLEDMTDVAFAIVKATIADYPVDEDRIYLSGVSSGGDGCWEFAIRYPNLFAAVVPLGSAGTCRPDLKSLKDVPIWAFHSDNDSMVSARYVRQTVQLLNDIGGNAQLTEIPSREHDCWTQAFQAYDVLDWLLAQHRHGNPPGPPPGTVSLNSRIKNAFRNWHWWQLLAEAGVIAIFAIGATVFFVRIRKPRAHRNMNIRELPDMDALLRQN